MKKDEIWKFKGVEAKRIDEPFTIELCPFCREPADKEYTYCIYCAKEIKGKKLIKEIMK